MKQFVVFANCQSGALAKTLLENEEFSSQYRWAAIPPVHTIKENHVGEVLAKVREADLLIYQPVSPSPLRPPEMTSDFLLGQTKKGCERLSFPSIYFDGYFPHLQTLKGTVSVLNLVHDYFIAYACAIGLTEEQCFSLINREDLYPEALSWELAENSLQALQRRERAEGIDIIVSDFIAANYKHCKLFNQFNHPKRAVFRHVAETILSQIGIANYRVNPTGESHLDMIMTPVYRSTHKNLRLDFEEDFDTYGAKSNLVLRQMEVIGRFFAGYRGLDTEELMAHVHKTKPFVADIVASHI